MSNVFSETHVVGAEGAKSHAFDQPVKLVNADGSEFTGGSSYTLPAATADALGGVKLAAVTPQVKPADAAQAAGDAPTKAEFDAVVALANANKAAINSVINAMRAAGQAADK